MNDFKQYLTDKIINYGLKFLSLISIPLNIIVYFALINSDYYILRIIPVFFGILLILKFIYRDKFTQFFKLRILVSLTFFTGLYTLLLGLLDMASLWFILSIIFALFDTKKNTAFIIFVIALFFIIATGLLLVLKNPYLPVDYGFENCQFACVSVRIINFLIIGFLIFKILNMFFDTINLYIEEILEKNIVLEQLKATEQKETEQKFINEMLRRDFKRQEAEIKFKRNQLTEATYKVIKFNNALITIKQYIKEKNYSDALRTISLFQSGDFGFESFLHKFNELYPDFIQNLSLRYPQLTKTDIKICVLITAGLKSVEIAEMLNISDISVAKYRNRIRKKLDLEQNADIAQYLLTKVNQLSNT